MNLHANQGTGKAYTALKTVFADNAPTESAFSQMRNRVSWKYFEAVFNQSAKDFCNGLRPIHKGYYLTAIDGDQYLVEGTPDALKHGFTGQKCGRDLETYGLKMYLTLATCMITGAPFAVTTGTSLNEIKSGIETTTKVSAYQSSSKINQDSHIREIFCYDSLFVGKELIETYNQLKTFFIVRCKAGGTFTEIKEFTKSEKINEIVEICGTKMRLIKATHGETQFC